MKQYRIDELRLEDYETLKTHLDERFGPCPVEGLYWIPLDDGVLDEVQAAHKDCQPFYFAVELQPEEVTFELLIRSRNRVRCDCIHYANPLQREHIISFADTMFVMLRILS